MKTAGSTIGKMPLLFFRYYTTKISWIEPKLLIFLVFFPFSFDESSEAGDKPEAADEADDEDDNNKWKRRRRRRPKATRPTSRRTSRRLPSSSSDYESEDFEGPEIVIDSNTSTDDDLDDENGIGGTKERIFIFICVTFIVF